MSPTNPGVLSSTERGIHGERDSGVSGSGLSNDELTGQGTGIGSHSGSVAHGDSMSPTNPGVLHSTKPGIHGARDAGTGGHGLSNTELIHDTGAGSGLTGETRSGLDSNTRDTGLTDSGTAGPQFTGTTKRDEGLIGSGVDNTGSGSGLTGSDTRDPGLTGGRTGGTGYDSNTRDTGLTGSGYDSNSRNAGLTGGGLSGAGSGYDSNTRDTGLTGSDATGSGYDSNSRNAGLTGGGLSGTGSGYDSNTRGSGLTGGGIDETGSGYDSNTRDSGLTGGITGGSGSGLSGNRSDFDTGTSGTGFGLTGDQSGRGLSGTGTGSGLTGSSGTGQSGVVGEAERYVEGSEKHHRGDGHPEDIVHPGPHVTGTAKALDPHLN